jgi:hypothetical protein
MTATVITRPESLKSPNEISSFLLHKLWYWLYHSLIVWGFLAIFFPALGATYLMVLAGLWALSAARGHSNATIINLVRRGADRKAATKK